MSKKGSNPNPPEGAQRPAPPPAPPYFGSIPKSVMRCRCADPEAHVIIHVRGGVAQGIESNLPVQVTILDYDTDGTDPKELVHVIHPDLESDYADVMEHSASAKTRDFDLYLAQAMKERGADE
tara:strand:+ start:628 stop:996 length:369 start_codon:yes stop_codon:yes gene_type:complete